MRKNEGANWGVYHLLLLLLVCKRSTPYLSSNHIRCDKKQWSLKMNRGAGSVLRIMERILGVGKGRERIMNFQQIAEKHMKKSLWRLLSVSLCLFHSLIFFSSVSLFLNLYLVVFYFCGFHDFICIYILYAHLSTVPIFDYANWNIIIAVQHYLFEPLYSVFFLLSMCKMSHRETAFIPTCIAGRNWATFQNN